MMFGKMYTVLQTFAKLHLVLKCHSIYENDYE